METLTVQAVYKKGVLKPKTKLNLPEDSVVELQIKAAKEDQPSLFGSLLGIWSHLSDAEVRDLEKNLARIRRASGRKVRDIGQDKPGKP